MMVLALQDGNESWNEIACFLITLLVCGGFLYSLIKHRGPDSKRRDIVKRTTGQPPVSMKEKERENDHG